MWPTKCPTPNQKKTLRSHSHDALYQFHILNRCRRRWLSAKRTITGIALPYNTEATVSGGQTVSFLPGSLPTEGKAPKLYMSHDASQAIGLVTERTDDDEPPCISQPKSQPQRLAMKP
jgi:hypothetical protein